VANQKEGRVAKVGGTNGGGKAEENPPGGGVDGTTMPEAQKTVST